MRRTEKAAAISTAAYILLGAGMIVVAALSGSVALTAEGIHTLTDSVTMIAVLIGLRLSERHTETFPFGLYKLENLIATAIGFLILFGAYELAMESIRNLSGEPGPLKRPGVLIALMAVSVIVKGLLAWYKNKVAKEEHSPSLRAEAFDSFGDIGSALAVLIGVSLVMAGVSKADAVAALIVVAFLAWSGIEIMFSGAKVLLDASIENEVLSQVRKIAEDHPGVREVSEVEGRNSGSYRFLGVTLVPKSRDIERADHVAGEVRERIFREVEKVDRVNISLKAEEKESVLCAVPLEEDRTTVSSHFGEADSFALIGIRLAEAEISWQETVLNPFRDLEKGKGVRVAEFLAQQGVELILVRKSMEGKGSHYALEAHDILELVRPEAEKLEDAEELLVKYVRG